MPSKVGSQEASLMQLRKERERSVQLHLFLLSHASRCQGDKCPSPNCARMKVLLRHEQVCKIRAKGGCGACKRIWALFHIHARQCKTSTATSCCHIPHCQEVRGRYLQIQEANKSPVAVLEEAATITPLEVVKI